MSKITPKNLHYDDSLPPFLARLKAGQASSDGRHEFAVARPKKARNLDDEAEDEPVYFNEDTGETLTKKEWEDKEAGEETTKPEHPAEKEEAGEAKDEADVKEIKGKEKLAAIGASKKRKVGKVVGGDDDEGQDRDIERAAKAVASISKKGKGETEDRKSEPTKTKGKTAKKGKKIKLSFGDDD